MHLRAWVQRTDTSVRIDGLKEIGTHEMRPDLFLGRGGLIWGGVYCNKPRSRIICRPQHAAAIREPRPYGSRGRTGAVAVRELWPYGSCGRTGAVAVRELWPYGSCGRTGAVAVRELWPKKTVFSHIWNCAVERRKMRKITVRLYLPDNAHFMSKFINTATVNGTMQST